MASAEGLNDAQKGRSVTALERAIDKVVIGDLTVVIAIKEEYTTVAATMYTESTATSRVPPPRSLILALREANKA